MDAGPIIAQKEQEVDSETTATELLPMMFTVGTDLLLAAMPGILSGTITMATATPQDESLVTKADMIDSSEGELRFWEESATQLLNKLRGFAMWPGVYMHVKVEGRDEIIKVKVIKARVVQDQSAYPSDVIELGPNKKDGLYCVCHDGTILELLIVQPATKKPFSAKDLKNGYPGETLRWCKEPVEVKV
jgi:methionyl-tRNA formyltransferase